ncbi:hypothetical protein T492DRAFT_831539 [Pavlovales sp. CCMP2436]|nr:hypothetical protein T492DRAFT_831539 [Pavlovales sp. CCMP2436]
MSALKRKGAWCAMTSGLCTLIRGKEEGALKAAFNLGGMYAASTRATFCIEPPGDSLDRSHNYALKGEEVQWSACPVSVPSQTLANNSCALTFRCGHGMYDRKEPAW